MRTVLIVAARLAAALGLVAVATYYLLASIPFSYYHFLQFPHFTWQPLFIRLHPLVLLAAVAGLLATIRRGPGGAARAVRYIAIAAVTTAACMAAAVIVPSMLSYELAAALAFVPLAFLTAAAAVQLLTRRDASPPQAIRRDGVAAVWLAGLAGTLCSAAYGLQGWSRTAANGQTAAEIMFAGMTSLASHVAAFMLAASAVALVWAIAARRGWPVGAERLVTSALAAGLLALVIRRSLLTALILSDVRAIGLATAFAIAIVIFVQSLVPLRQSGALGRGPLIVAGAVVAALCVAILPHALLLADWGSTLQKLLVLGTWASCFALAAGLTLGRNLRRVLAGAVCGVLVGISTVAAVAPRGHARAAADLRRPLDVRLAIERYAVVDTSLSVLLDLFRPMVTDGAFFSVLRRAGDATDDRSLAPVSLRLIEQDAPAPYRPHIFVIVVDSMRPDYLSPYNPKVTFTPAIDAFARESIVMRRAYTPYAGTALSQPAIWAGGLIQRAMYVKPFAAVNNLERLLGTNSYRRYLSVDEILSVILEDWRDVVRLDGHLVHPERMDQMFKFDVCTTIDELKGRLDQDNFEQPVFFYSQPQSLHIRVLAGKAFAPSLDTRSAPSQFFPPVVNALRRIDTCLGGLVDYLKRRGVYDNSVVVLTSDHGDSYGEGGRWGHAFYVAPEILRIPLIIHVPTVVRETRKWDADALALLTDVTPTLYDLMGYLPAQPNGLRGRSLLHPRTGPAPPARPFTLIQGSYNRIFGLLDGEARWLYTADAGRNREALFDMRDGGIDEGPLLPAERVQFRGWLLDRLGELGRFYVGHDVE